MASFPNFADDDGAPDRDLGPAIIDEADMILPSDSAPISDGGYDPELSTNEAAGGLDSNAESLKPQLPRDGISLPTRPGLRRDYSLPAPRQPPPPTPPPQLPDLAGNQTDSLSLQQLRRLVQDIPKVEPTPYAFTYQDASTFAEELQEWFTYSIEERARVSKAQSSFSQEWGTYNNSTFVQGSAYEGGAFDWINTSPERRKEFLEHMVEGLSEVDLEKRLRRLEALVYLILGCWHETAGLATPKDSLSEDGDNTGSGEAAQTKPSVAADSAYSGSQVQIDWMKVNTMMLLDCKGVKPVHEILRSTCERECLMYATKSDTTTIQKEAEQRETWCSMTLMYVCLEVARTCEDEQKRLSIRSDFLSIQPNLLVLLGKIVNHIRWDDTNQLPLVKILLLLWKGTLVFLGGLAEVEAAKASFQKKTPVRESTTKPFITASPLDYHVFRQEISSKYPAYTPPPSIFPLEPDQKSLLPPLRPNHNKSTVSAVQTQTAQHGSSILHQPVHIATPAPSPPPSPAAGKGGKKQNYQTNQLFPFLYPPLDSSSNELGGKGTTNVQDVLVGRKWMGADIPTSILEASELFQERIRATRSLKQLWEERVEFMKYERGWADVDKVDDIEPFDLDSADEKEETGESEKRDEGDEVTEHLRVYDGSVKDRLETAEEFYRDGLPNLQSLVMVVLKTILSNVTALITQSATQNGVQGGFHFQENPNGVNTTNGNENTNGIQDASTLSIEDLDALRTQEITAKAASGLLLVMLKWFKVSHILKFEYLSQLLVDANYIPMILKLLQTQEIEKMVNYRSDRLDYDFFYYCRTLSRNWTDHPGIDQSEIQDDYDDSDDDALPPPIKRHREEPLAQPEQSNAEQTKGLAIPPAVDELGVPTSELPKDPITTFSWRNFFSSINFLRILQKVCKSKAHRNLMLVTYKSATYLKKSLKVPQPELRLYTLKLFKNQVPYCGRKWRQSNMRVITAVYLHCRPELRDDWLCNTDVDNDVEQSVPMEQALRALTHWYNLKHYPKQMGAQSGILAEERDFFVRELEKIDWGEADIGGDDVSLDWDPSMPVEHL